MYGGPYKMYGASYILYGAAHTCMVRAVLYCTVLRAFSHFHAIYRCFPYSCTLCKPHSQLKIDPTPTPPHPPRGCSEIENVYPLASYCCHQLPSRPAAASGTRNCWTVEERRAKEERKVMKMPATSKTSALPPPPLRYLKRWVAVRVG